MACTGSVKQEELYGRWNYIKVKNADPEDITSDEEVKREAPAIIFNSENELFIEWGGKQLSHGKYKLDGRMIRYTEFLEGGRKREFPFLITEIDGDKLIFETMEKNYPRVTAIKAK